MEGGLGGWVLNIDTSETNRFIAEPLTKEQIKEIYLISPCPVQDCVNKNKMYRWTHVKCGGGRLSLNDEGMLRCVKCGKKGKFVDFRFDCGDHDSKECSAQGVSHSLAFMAQRAEEKSQQKFIAKITASLMQQFSDRGKESEKETRYKGGNEKGKHGINLCGEESNESPFQNVEDPQLQLNKSEQKSFQEESKHKSKEEVLEFDLISPCPVQECVTKNTMYKWTHKKCGGQLKLNVKGMVRCHECGTQVKYVDWPFNCGAHNGKKTCSLMGATHALEVASQLEANKNHKELIKKALQVIINDTFDDTKIEAIGKKI
jgi:hypothetical protein